MSSTQSPRQAATMREALFRAHRPLDGWNHRLVTPTVTHVATRLDEVIPVLACADRAAAEGRWAVVAIAYEAAPAFEPAMGVTPSPDQTPLAIVAEFAASAVTPLPNAGSTPPEAPAARLAARPAASQGMRPRFEPTVDGAAFAAGVEQVQAYIRSGDTYQVNLTMPLVGEGEADGRAWFERLCARQQGDYAAWIDLGAHQLLSVSPELFFERRNGRLITRPMKGTSRRGRWRQEDDALAQALATSAKARAENVMIVDLLRNDLGRLATTGSVDVTSLFALEAYPTLWQLTSTVEADVPASTSLVDIFRALFPCGSVTGAPKIRTMAIIREVEQAPRGFYTGTIGLVRPGGDAIFNVAIRTIAIERETREAVLGVGAGITIDSDPDAEYAESLLKGTFASHDAETPDVPFALIETLGLEQGRFARLDGHLARLTESAAFFGLPCDIERVRDLLLETGAAHPEGSWRVRVEVRANVAPILQCDAFAGTRQPWRVAFAPAPVNEDDPLLCHKTTWRHPYERARRARPDVDDVLLWNRRGEVTESTIANIVVELDGRRITPARESGLLPGVLRAELLSSGEIEEGALTRGMVGRAERLWLVNSLRGWIDAILIR